MGNFSRNPNTSVMMLFRIWRQPDPPSAKWWAQKTKNLRFPRGPDPLPPFLLGAAGFHTTFLTPLIPTTCELLFGINVAPNESLIFHNFLSIRVLGKNHLYGI
jgi:hypothetical protein